MPARLANPRLNVLSPMRLFGLVLLTVFVVEGAIMLLLSRIPGSLRGEITDTLIDASVLTLIVAPVVWRLAIRPLRQVFDERGRLLRQTFESQERERARIAADLHDGIGQQMTALLVGLSSVDSTADLQTARDRARDLRNLAADVHEEVRRLAHGLRPAVLEDMGLGPAIERLCRDFERIHDVAVRCRCDLHRRLDPAVETAVYRIVQEAMNNTAKHADAKHLSLDVADQNGLLDVSIEDDGRGIDPAVLETAVEPSDGMGLRGIRERVILLRGQFLLESPVAGGTSIRIRIPLES